MTFWLRVRRMRTGVAVVAIVVLLLVAVGDLAVPMLSLAVLAEVALPVSLVAPVALAIVVTWSLARGDERLEGVAVRPVAAFDAALALALTGGFACLTIVLDLGGFMDLGVESARNAFGLTGLALITRWLTGSGVAGVVPVAYVIVVGFFGGQTVRSAEWWAWLIRPAGSGSAVAQAITLFMIGLALTWLGRREPAALR